MSWLLVALLAGALIVLAGAEWPRVSHRFGWQARTRRVRARKKQNLRLIRSESDEFAESVERDLANLPTIEERDGRRR